MKIISKVLGFVCALIVAIPLWAQHFPALTGYVVDEAGVLTDQERYEMTQRLQALQPQQIVVATVTSLDGYDIDQYANLLFRHWALGDKDRDDGVLILLAPNERFVRIEVGYGLEDVLTDALSGQIVHNKILPLARQNKFAEALRVGVDDVSKVLSGVTPDFPAHDDPSFPVQILLPCFLLPFLLPLITRLSKINFVRKNSSANRFFFFLYIFCFSVFYIPFFAITFIAPFIFSILFCCLFLLPHYYFMVVSHAIWAWKKDPLFPFNQLTQHSKSHGGHGFSGGGFGGGGGGGFGGGGGSSGGGGASGGF